MIPRATFMIVVLAACSSSVSVLRNPSTVATSKSVSIGDAVCWVEPKWMYPGPSDCHGYSEPAPGVPKCTSTKPEPATGLSRTYWSGGYDYDAELTAKTRTSEPLACCYRCVDKLHDLGQ